MLLYQARSAPKPWHGRLQRDLEQDLSSSGMRNASAASWDPSSLVLNSRGTKSCSQVWGFAAPEQRTFMLCVGPDVRKHNFSIAAWWICAIFSSAAVLQCPLLHPSPDLVRWGTLAAWVLVPWETFVLLFPWHFWEVEKKDLEIASTEGWATASTCDFLKVTNRASCLSFSRHIMCVWLSSSTIRSQRNTYKAFWGKKGIYNDVSQTTSNINPDFLIATLNIIDFYCPKALKNTKMQLKQHEQSQT